MNNVTDTIYTIYKRITELTGTLLNALSFPVVLVFKVFECYFAGTTESSVPLT